MIESRFQVCTINAMPHIYEIEDMVAFCKRYQHLYIYGSGENQEYLLKFLDFCEIQVDGYVVTQKTDQYLHYRAVPIIAIDDVISQEDTGILLGLSDRYFGKIIPTFRRVGFNDYFVISEYNKRTIADQMRPRSRESMTFEVNLADHCNMDCQMCDHYSQLAEEHFLDIDEFKYDIERMAEIFEHEIGCITLLGGEPTLHKDLIKCMEIVREQFPHAEIIILTNGLLLLRSEHAPQGNLWQACKENRVFITVTVYPINLDYEALERKAEEYGVSLVMSSNIHNKKSLRVVKISDKHTLDLSGQVGKCYFSHCLYFNKFNVLKDGRYYMCPIAAHSGIFNKSFDQNLQLEEGDSLDIYKVKSWEELAEFSANRIPFCKYCDIKNWHAHSEWKRSTKQMDEYV